MDFKESAGYWEKIKKEMKSGVKKEGEAERLNKLVGKRVGIGKVVGRLMWLDLNGGAGIDAGDSVYYVPASYVKSIQEDTTETFSIVNDENKLYWLRDGEEDIEWFDDIVVEAKYVAFNRVMISVI